MNDSIASEEGMEGLTNWLGTYEMNERWFVDQEQWMIFVTTVTGALYSSQVVGLQVWMCGMYAILLVCSCPQKIGIVTPS